MVVWPLDHDVTLLVVDPMIQHDDFGIALFYLTIFHLFCRQNTLGYVSLTNFHASSPIPEVMELKDNLTHKYIKSC